MIDISEGFDNNFYIKLIRDIICHEINNIIVIFNKIVKFNFDDNLRKIFEYNINNIKNKFSSYLI